MEPDLLGGDRPENHDRPENGARLEAGGRGLQEGHLAAMLRPMLQELSQSLDLSRQALAVVQPVDADHERAAAEAASEAYGLGCRGRDASGFRECLGIDPDRQRLCLRGSAEGLELAVR